jgi:hypothetical protein
VEEREEEEEETEWMLAGLEWRRQSVRGAGGARRRLQPGPHLYPVSLPASWASRRRDRRLA